MNHYTDIQEFQNKQNSISKKYKRVIFRENPFENGVFDNIEQVDDLIEQIQR